MGLQKINIETNNVSLLVPFANRIIGFPSIKGDTVFYLLQ